MRHVAVAGSVVGLAGAMLVLGVAVGSPTVPAAAPPTVTTRPAILGEGISALESELQRLPTNHRAWGELGSAYVEQARVAADPSYYARAERALSTSMELQPVDNFTALTGQASLAAARHDFAAALALADQALGINDYAVAAYAVKTDALVELGRFDEARDTLERMFALRPAGVAALTRASYVLELEGDVVGARTALERAGAVATLPADEAFVQYYLGELDWNAGDLPAARQAYQAALTADPDYIPARAGLAKVRAASGDLDGAIEQYEQVVARQPQPEFLVQLGELLEAAGREDAAQQQYDVVRAIQQLYAANGQDVDTELAVFEADHGSPAVAVSNAERSYRARPQAIFAQDAYAWALHAAGRSQEALPLARQAVRTGLRLPTLYYHLGVIEAATGHAEAAKEALTNALDLNAAFSPLHAPRAAGLLEDLS